MMLTFKLLGKRPNFINGLVFLHFACYSCAQGQTLGV